MSSESDIFPVTGASLLVEPVETKLALKLKDIRLRGEIALRRHFRYNSDGYVSFQLNG